MKYWIDKPRNKKYQITPFILLLFISLAGVSSTSFGQEALDISRLTANKTEFSNRQFLFWENTANRNPNIPISASFEKLPHLYPNFGFTNNDVWFRFILQNTSNDTVERIFWMSNPNLDEIDLYQSNSASNAWKTVAKIGDKRPITAKKIDNRNFALPIQLNPMTRDTFYLRVNNGGEQFHFVPAIVNNDFFISEDAGNQLFFGIYFGVLTFIFIFNLFSFFALRDKTALWYAGYVVSFGILQISLTGIGTHQIWDNYFIAERANPFFASLSLLFLLYFTMDYLQLKKIMPRVNQLFQVFHILIVVSLLFSVIPNDLSYRISVVGINSITLLLDIIVLPIAVFAIRKNLLEAKLFLIAFSVLSISVFGFILKNFGLLPSVFLTDFGLQIGSALEAILLSIGIVLKYKSTRDTAIQRLETINELVEKTNLELEQKVSERTQEVENQRDLLEVKNVEIVSSINYARRIQESLLPSPQLLKQLFPNSAIWYAPKDIVAGDFYWLNQIQFNDTNWTFFAVADCTGHGVPGAMMSVLCYNALDLALKNLDGPDPGVLLEKVAHFLSENLSKNREQLADGMDISLLCMDEKSRIIHWTGANNPLWLLRDQEVIQYAPTRRPVGKTEQKTHFSTHIIQAQPNDRIFLFTDGYVDQFGGPNGKKLKKINFLRSIEETAGFDIESQIGTLKKRFYDWKSNQVQVDDVCLFGMEI